MPFVRKQYKHSSLTLHNIICVRLIDRNILEIILNRIHLCQV